MGNYCIKSDFINSNRNLQFMKTQLFLYYKNISLIYRNSTLLLASQGPFNIWLG